MDAREAMKPIETEGKTVEEAIKKACEELQATRRNWISRFSPMVPAGFGAGRSQEGADSRHPQQVPPSPGKRRSRRLPSVSGTPPAETAQKTLEDLLRLIESKPRWNSVKMPSISF